MARALRTIMQSILAPVLSTSLYFVVFGAAIGSKISTIDTVSYGAFIIPGLVMLSVMTTSVNFAAFGIYLPKYNGSIFELMSAPISAYEIVIGYAGAAASKSILISILILLTSTIFGLATKTRTLRVKAYHFLSGSFKPFGTSFSKLLESIF